MTAISKRHTEAGRRLEERRERAIDLVCRGATYAEAAEEVGAYREQVAGWCKRARVRTSPEAAVRARRSR